MTAIKSLLLKTEICILKNEHSLAMNICANTT